MYRQLFNFVKKKIPKISDTELIALRSGNTSIDRQILHGKVEFPTKFNYKDKFPDRTLNYLLKNFDNSLIYPNNNQNKWINYLAKNKFFSFLIHENYGGIKLSNNDCN